MTSSQISPASSKISEEIQKLDPSAVITLFVLSYTADVNGIDEVIRYHAGTNELKSDIKFGSHTYSAFPVEVSGFDKTTTGTLPRPKFKVSNVNNVLSAFIQLYNPLGGSVQRVQTCVKFLNSSNFAGTNANADSTAIFNKNDIWYIDRISEENPEFVEFELTPKINLQNLRIPKRQITEHCPWKYRSAADAAAGNSGSPECGYKGQACFTADDVKITSGTLAQKQAQDKCGHKYSSCVARFGQYGEGGTKKKPTDLPFGGFINARIQL
tara:strand:- start:9154 stop:9960 length:807 start_codon:yes stop_codon:yes gene_type:complete